MVSLMFALISLGQIYEGMTAEAYLFRYFQIMFLKIHYGIGYLDINWVHNALYVKWSFQPISKQNQGICNNDSKIFNIMNDRGFI